MRLSSRLHARRWRFTVVRVSNPAGARTRPSGVSIPCSTSSSSTRPVERCRPFWLVVRSFIAATSSQNRSISRSCTLRGRPRSRRCSDRGRNCSRSARWTVATDTPCRSAHPCGRDCRSADRGARSSSFPRSVTSVSSEGRRRRMSRRRFGDVVVERRLRDPHHPANLDDGVLLLGVELDREPTLSRFQHLGPPALAPAGARRA